MIKNELQDIINKKHNFLLSIIDNREKLTYRDSILLKCKDHGEYTIRLDHLLDYGCKDCSKHKKNTLKQEKFINRGKQIHGNRYGYDKVYYLNNHKKVILICKKHGEFEISPLNHLNKQGCKKCSSKQLNLETFIEKAKAIHGEKFDYSKTNYTSVNDKLDIVCKKHGIFSQRGSSHLEGVGCPSCNESLGEKIISKYLDEKNIKYLRQKKFDECRFKYPLKFDFYINEFDICIEFDGIQHFKPIDYFGGIERFEYEQKLSLIKDNFCQNKGIKLFRIKYNDNLIEKLDIIFNKNEK